MSVDPITMMAAGQGINVVSNLLGGDAAVKAGKYQQSVSYNNADLYNQKADQAIEIGNRNVERFNKSFDRAEAATHSAYIAAGVKMEGTPLEVVEQNLYEAEIERMNIMYDANVTAYDFKRAAVDEKYKGDFALYQARQQRASMFVNAVTSTIAAGANIGMANQAAANAKQMIDAQAANNKILTDMISENSKRFINLNNNINMNLFKTSMENQVRLATGGNLLLEAQQ